MYILCIVLAYDRLCSSKLCAILPIGDTCCRNLKYKTEVRWGKYKKRSIWKPVSYAVCETINWGVIRIYDLDHLSIISEYLYSQIYVGREFRSPQAALRWNLTIAKELKLSEREPNLGKSLSNYQSKLKTQRICSFVFISGVLRLKSSPNAML